MINKVIVSVVALIWFTALFIEFGATYTAISISRTGIGGQDNEI